MYVQKPFFFISHSRRRPLKGRTQRIGKLFPFEHGLPFLVPHRHYKLFLWVLANHCLNYVSLQASGSFL